MRKELVIYLPTTEQDIDISVRRPIGDKSAVLLSVDNFKVAINAEQLVAAIAALKEFYSGESEASGAALPPSTEHLGVDYDV